MGDQKKKQTDPENDPISTEEQDLNAKNMTEPVGEDQEPVCEEDRLKAELETASDRYLRLYAEFDNYKRRTSKERVELMQSAGKEVIANLLTVLDDFDRALKMMETATDVPAIVEGIELISQKFKKVLQQQGLKEMEVIGQPFDADLQEAITNIPAPDENMKGKVIDQLEKGYFLNDKVLRYAKVVVGN